MSKTKGKASGKLCKIIVDSGSIEKVVSLEMVEKAWVDFKLGEYRDRVLCEIIPMNAFHLILDMLWKYDVKSQKNGAKTIYLIEKCWRQFKIDLLPDHMVKGNDDNAVRLIKVK